ncbi:hypothetical protein EXS65_01205 [Candidatus Peribacteria bacterium]|nr:hypothetical protein [Candidatus Peribacteria bacterium]
MHRVVCGLIGPTCTSQARTKWNALFLKHGRNAFFDFYRTKTVSELELRLSEMFLHERRGYVVAAELQEIIVPLLDRLDASVTKEQRVDTVTNEGGVLVGSSSGDDDQRRMELWFRSGSS